MNSRKLRKKFLDFFAARDHRIIPSSSLVPDDPTLLLTAAGMVQFKKVFSGEKKVDYARAATIQKCVRTTDIERVGETARHLTFFEMLGNFSFGDYYKRESIKWAWELITDDLKVDKDRLYITIYQDDDESFAIWHEEMGIHEDRIFRMTEKDNFWSAGPTGPCGPCSEILYDQGENVGCGRPGCKIGCECDRFLEIWNLVFTEFDRDEEGNLHALPRKNIDTGMGLERIAAVMQDVPTVFDTDLFKPIIRVVSKVSGVRLGESGKSDVSIRIIADHARAAAFLIGDGVVPSNEGRGYVLRRLIRRAIRHGRLLGVDEPFFVKVIGAVLETMEDAYRELAEHADYIRQTAEKEEERFLSTLRQGLIIIEEVIEELMSEKATTVPGEVVFRLYDTYGFPVDLTREIALENGLSIAEEEFEKLMEEQRRLSRAKQRFVEADGWAGDASKEIYRDVLEEYGKSDFVGHEVDEVETTIKAIIRGNAILTEADEGEEVELVFEKTPFYAEKGGQIGDRGVIETAGARAEIVDTQEYAPKLISHRGKVVTGKLKMGEQVRAKVDVGRRQAIRRAHTATHVLHWALRLVLGEHAKQAGSLVEPDRLRFDFTHFSALSEDEIKKVERLVNEKVFEHHAVRAYITSLEFAKESGAVALFGEKYGEFVRVVEVGNFSRELCGGSHLGNTSEIGLVKILTEASIGANTRRIEALCGMRAYEYFSGQDATVSELAVILKSDKAALFDRVNVLLSTVRSQEQELLKLQESARKSRVSDLVSSARSINGAQVVLERVEAPDMESLRSYVDLLREKLPSSVVLLASESHGRVLLVAGATSDLVKAGVHAGDLLKKVAPLVGGGGGGRPDMAQAGGKHPEKIAAALEEAWAEIKTMLEIGDEERRPRATGHTPKTTR
ncbi:MAG: alanine--tRNA ligase [Actinobacteria bacterium]|nr:alanine--tRNA ligase [Actinomycetota bacterium]